MKKNNIFSIYTFSIFIFITLYGISLVYSEENPARPEKSHLIGRVYKNNAIITFRGASVNEFILCDNCGGCSFKYSFSAPSKEIKAFLLNLSGEQVILSGELLSIPFDKLKEENSSSKCLETLSGQNISFFRAEKADKISFYKYVVPDKINWDDPVKVKLHFKNPFEYIITLSFDLFSLDSHLKEQLILKEKEEKDIEINFNLSKKEWARNFGMALILEIRASSKKDNHIIYFSDKIAFYGPDGELVMPEK